MSIETLEQPLEAAPKGKLLSGVKLAKRLGVSRWTVTAMKLAGYKYPYGRKTTEEHARKWLEDHQDFIPSHFHHAYQERERERKGQRAAAQG